MLRRYREGSVPARPDDPRRTCAGRCHAPGGGAPGPGRYDPQTALVAIWELVTRANGYVEQTAPWTLARARAGRRWEAAARLDGVLVTLVEGLRVVGEALRPFLPSTAGAVLSQLGQAPAPRWEEGLRWGAALGTPPRGEWRPPGPSSRAWPKTSLYSGPDRAPRAMARGKDGQKRRA